MGGFFQVAWAVAGRQIYKYFTNPAFLAPALFPLFFFVAFAGGLTRVGDVPGFDYAAGYIAFQYVWALLQAVSMGGAFTGFSIAGDFSCSPPRTGTGSSSATRWPRSCAPP
jgi:ABC-2 type transport system permease protein